MKTGPRIVSYRSGHSLMNDVAPARSAALTIASASSIR